MSYICLPMQGNVINKDIYCKNIYILQESSKEKMGKVRNILGWNNDQVKHIEKLLMRIFLIIHCLYTKMMKK